MRPSLLCLVLLLTPLCAAHAEQTGGVVRPEIKPAIEADASTDAGPLLDLSFDPAVAAVQDLAPLVPQAAATAPEAERRFSLGLDIKSRREIGSPAVRATAEPSGPPTLADKLEGIVERSTIGVTGTYRF